MVLQILIQRINSITALIIIYGIHLIAEPPTITLQKIDELTQKIAVSFALSKKDCIYKDFIQFSVDNPHTQLSKWHATKIAATYYDPLFKASKNIFTNRVTFFITATTQAAHHEPTHLYFSYYQRSAKKIQQMKYCISDNKHNIATTPSNTINTSLVLDHSSAKIAAYHTAPIDMYRSFIYAHAKHYLAYLNFTDSIHICLIILLLLLCIIPPYFFSKKLHPSVQLYELIIITTATSCFVLMAYGIYYVHFYCAPQHTALLITLYTAIIGVFYTKKSTSLAWSYLRTLCHLLGIILIVSSVLMLFKTVQLFFPV